MIGNKISNKELREVGKLMVKFRKHSGIAISIYLIASVLLTGCGAQNIRSPAQTANIQDRITVMAFNIRHGCGRVDMGNTSGLFFSSCKEHMDQIIGAIRSIDPDIVGLQEVHDGQGAQIAKALKLNYIYSPHNPSGYASTWGNAILTKFKITGTDNRGIGGISGRSRSAVAAKMIINNGPVAVISVHTHHRQFNKGSVQNLSRFVDELAVPTLLVGDFNMVSNDNRLDVFKKKGFIDTADSAPSSRSLGTWMFSEGRRIDYVFADSRRFTVLDANIVSKEHRAASDHLAYYAVLALK